MKKKAASREKTAPVQEKDLMWVKGSSGYLVATGDGPTEPTDPPPPDGEG
jgi:hypothetical protein